jgi:hypothetical protein
MSHNELFCGSVALRYTFLICHVRGLPSATIPVAIANLRQAFDFAIALGIDPDNSTA